MIHTIIYDNRQNAGGYNFYEHTPNFPEEALPEIRNACQCVNSDGNYGTTHNLRYQPLTNRYLLSVIFRLSQGSDQSSRSIHRIVNFLMDSADASRLFDLPFAQTGPQLVQHAIDLLQSPYELLSEGLPFLEAATSDRGDKPANRFSPATLLAAASYCQNSSQLRKQAFFGTDSDPLNEIDALMQYLPRELRKGISFQTDILNVAESTDIALNFGKLDTIAKMHRGNFMGGPSSNKYVYYPGEYLNLGYVSQEDGRTNAAYGEVCTTLYKLPSRKLFLRCMKTWEDFRHLGSLPGDKNLHTAALQLIPQEDLLGALKKMTPDQELLLALNSACPKKYRQLHKYLSEKLTPAKAQPARIQEQPSQAESPRRSDRTGTQKHTSAENGVSLMAYGSLLISLLGGVLGLAVLWKLLKKLIDLHTVIGDAQLNITISLSDSIGLLRIVGSFLLGALLALVFSRLFKEIARLFRKK